ncbi:MAG: aldolase/citrate lyase family protein [Chloroflexia bacterium]
MDTEHNAFDIHTLGLMFAAMAGTPVAPMVRIPWNTPEHFKRVLDAGAWGVVVPMVNSREEAERAVEAVRYPPLGARSVGGSRHALSCEAAPKEDYERANDELLLVVQIEHIQPLSTWTRYSLYPGLTRASSVPTTSAPRWASVSASATRTRTRASSKRSPTCRRRRHG